MEEHLLLCCLCQDRLTEWEDYIRQVRTSLRRLGTRTS
jgi:hypothetical protein